MYIETERLIVRTMRAEDADALYRIKTDPQVTEYIPDFLDRGARREDMPEYIRRFQEIEQNGDLDSWRCYAIVSKASGETVGTLSFCRQNMLHEYELGWEMNGSYSGNGYAAEAAAAFSEYFCQKHRVDYLIVIMDTDNPASYHTALNSGFRLFEKRTVYDYALGRYSDDYFYFRRYFSGCTLKERFYGDVPYTGRGAE